MTRIFTTLAITDALALTLTFAAGWWSKLSGGVSDPSTKLYLLHFLLGLATGVGTLLVHCLIFTYSLGTGRWVREVTLAYALPDEPLYRRTRDLKRWIFPRALTAMLLAIATSATGAGVQLQHWPWWLHFGLGTVTLLFNFYAFVAEYRFVAENVTILDRVLVEVDRVRAERDLPTNAAALAEEGR